MKAPLKPRLGVIGGLGPLASADFYRKITDLTPAKTDRDHVSLALLSLPNLPDRSTAILSGSDALLTPLLDAVAMLNALGVERIAMPCNTAHHWYEQLSAKSDAEIVHIVESVVDDLRQKAAHASAAILATPGTLASGFYQEQLLSAGYEIRMPNQVWFQESVDSAINLVKAGNVATAAKALDTAIKACCEKGADAVILACTELSVLTGAIQNRPPILVDSNAALAKACLRRLGIEPLSCSAIEKRSAA